MLGLYGPLSKDGKYSGLDTDAGHMRPVIMINLHSPDPIYQLR